MARVATCALLLAVVLSAAEEEDDVDRTDFSDPSLKEDKAWNFATQPHSELTHTWILPRHQNGQVPVGVTSDMLIALTNTGGKMFNVSNLAGSLLDKAGKTVARLPRFELGEPLGPREQRSYRYPMEVSAETPLGEYTLEAKVYYNTRDKEPFVSTVARDPVTLVPKPPEPSQFGPVEMVGAALAGLLLIFLLKKLQGPGGAAAAGGAPQKSPKKRRPDSEPSEPKNEWLAGTLAGSEGKGGKKAGRK